MKILVINAGSSSLKYKLIDMKNNLILANGICERIGIKDSFINHKTLEGKKYSVNVDIKDHTQAFMLVKNILLNNEYGVIKNLDEVFAIGHRIVQGGSLFKKSVLINDKVIKDIESLIPLAPLHNKAHVQGIKACIDVFGKSIPQVAVFDTSFHSTMPEKSFMFAVPYKYYRKYKLRKYGFHGISHRYVSNRCAELMGKNIKDLKIITCHLGNGSSIAAIDCGKVIDTSMGLTPLGGFMMGTRSGSLDPSVVTFIAEKENLSPLEVDLLLNKKSGFLGVSGISSDDRDLENAIKKGNKRALLAFDMFEYQITKFIGAYTAALNGCDAIVFTAGIGENQASHRQNICEHLSYLGLKIDKKINKSMIRGNEGQISTKNSKIQVFVIPTNEELVIAEDTLNIVNKQCIH